VGRPEVYSFNKDRDPAKVSHLGKELFNTLEARNKEKIDTQMLRREKLLAY